MGRREGGGATRSFLSTMKILVVVGYLLLVVTVGADDDVLFSNSWAVEIRGGPEMADLLARKHGFANRGLVCCYKYLQ